MFPFDAPMVGVRKEVLVYKTRPDTRVEDSRFTLYDVVGGSEVVVDLVDLFGHNENSVLKLRAFFPSPRSTKFTKRCFSGVRAVRTVPL